MKLRTYEKSVHSTVWTWSLPSLCLTQFIFEKVKWKCVHTRYLRIVTTCTGVIFNTSQSAFSDQTKHTHHKSHKSASQFFYFLTWYFFFNHYTYMCTSPKTQISIRTRPNNSWGINQPGTISSKLLLLFRPRTKDDDNDTHSTAIYVFQLNSEF